MQPDTTLGGSDKRFPETSLGFVSPLHDPSSGRYRASLETLCERYWKPVYGYVRAAWAKGNEDAKDLTQAFFVWLLEGSALQRFERERGSFRTYLRTLLKRFVGHQELALHRLKRGGGVKLLSLEGTVPTIPEADPKTADPEKVFERVWLTELVDRALDRVRERHVSSGETVALRVYQDFELAPEPERPTYRELAARLGIAEGDVKTHLFAVRREVRAELRAELAQITENDRDLEDEWNRLFGP
jgi:RNA polymerase sigma factor (sigma-70 family)